MKRRITFMRAPNAMVFIVTAILAFIGAGEYLAIPLSIPEIKIPLVGITSGAIPPFLAAHAFWFTFSAWALLAIGALLPRSVGSASQVQHHLAKPQSAS
jgi:hypothetical protein